MKWLRAFQGQGLSCIDLSSELLLTIFNKHIKSSCAGFSNNTIGGHDVMLWLRQNIVFLLFCFNQRVSSNVAWSFPHTLMRLPLLRSDSTITMWSVYQCWLLPNNRNLLLCLWNSHFQKQKLNSPEAFLSNLLPTLDSILWWSCVIKCTPAHTLERKVSRNWPERVCEITTLTCSLVLPLQISVPLKTELKHCHLREAFSGSYRQKFSLTSSSFAHEFYFIALKLPENSNYIVIS